jgi:TolB-like protein
MPMDPWCTIEFETVNTMFTKLRGSYVDVSTITRKKEGRYVMSGTWRAREKLATHVRRQILLEVDRLCP